MEKDHCENSVGGGGDPERNPACWERDGAQLGRAIEKRRGERIPYRNQKSRREDANVWVKRTFGSVAVSFISLDMIQKKVRQ